MAVLDYSQQVPAADRALSILEVLGQAGEGLTTVDLLNEVGGSRSGLYALLNTLKARDFVVSEEGRYRLGPALWSLLPDRPSDLETLVDAFAEETAASLADETIALLWPDRGGTVVAATAEPDRPVHAVLQSGSRRLQTGPDARVLAAGLPDDTDDLRLIRQTGLASRSTAETVEVAVPVCRDGVRPTAVVMAAVPLHRAEPPALEAIETAIRGLAARLSYRLGALSYQPYGWTATESVGPTRDLDSTELDAFLEGLWGAQLACVRTDGTPHVVPLWYEWDGEAIWLAASPGSSWRTYIADNPRVSVTLDEPWPPLRRAFLSGEAVDVPDSAVPGGVEGLRRRLAIRYLGKGADQPELSDTVGWAAVRLVPDRIHGRQGLGGYGAEQ